MRWAVICGVQLAQAAVPCIFTATPPRSCCSGELFGVCPVPRGQLHIAVEAATDSSRNFVLRLEDAGSKRHAFIGMNFADRSAAFDFNVSLVRGLPP